MKFDPVKTLNRIMEFNPFKPKTKEEDLSEKQYNLSRLSELKELLEASEHLSSDARYQKLRKLRKDQLSENIEILKTIKTTDSNVAKLQGQIQALEEELDMPKILRQKIAETEGELVSFRNEA